MGDSDLNRLETCIQWCEASPSSPQGREAFQVLNDLRTRPDAWATGLELFTQGQLAASRLFGLNLIKEHLSSADISVQSRTQLRSVIIEWLRYTMESHEYAGMLQFLKAAVAHVITLMIKLDYPEYWGSAFDDLFAITAFGGEPAVDLMLRILQEVEAEIVTYGPNRTDAEILHNSVIKDAMRASDVTMKIVNMLYDVLASSEQHTSDFVERAIDVLQEMIGWVDINLVVNEQFMPLLYAFVEHQNPILREGALGCWKEIVLRGMDAAQKLQMLEQVRFLEVLQRVQIDEATVLAVADLCACTFEHVMGIAQMGGGWQTGTPFATTVSGILEVSLSLALQCLAHENPEGGNGVTTAFDTFVIVVKQQLNQPTEGQLFVAADHLPTVLMTMCNRMRYPQDFDFDLDDEEESAEETLKHCLRKSFVNIARVYPTLCLDLVTSVLCSLPQPLSSAPFPDVEVALRLMYHFGECGPAKHTQLKEGTFPALLLALHESDVDQHPHWAVCLAYYEVCARYSWVFQDRPNLLEKVVGDMLGNSGIRNNHPTLRARAAYQLFKTVESTIPASVALLAPIVRSLQDILYAAPSQDFLSSEDFQHLYGAIGFLCAVNPPVDAHQQMEVLRDTMSALLRSISEILNDPDSSRSRDLYGDLLAHRLTSMASLTKGFKAAVPANLLPLFETAMEAALAVLSAFANHANVRARFTTLLHRMVVCLKESILPHLGDALSTLVMFSEIAEFDQVVPLLNNILIEFDGRSVQIMNQLLIPMMEKRTQLQGVVSQEGDAPHQATVTIQIDKNFFQFLQQVTARGCSAILYSDLNANYLPDLLVALVETFAQASDPILRKSPVSSLSNLVQEWGTDASLSVQAPFLQFMYDQALPTIITACVNGSIDRRDAECLGLVADIGGLLWTMHKARGDEFLQYINQVVRTSLGWTDNHVQQLMTILSDPKIQAVRDPFKRFVMSL